MFPFRNGPQSFVTGVKDPKGVLVREELSLPEKYPMKVTCDFHSWMSAYLLVLDHPYMAISDEKGNFQIKNLPAGEHSFYLWHEELYAIDKKFKVTVKAGQTTNLGQVKIDLREYNKSLNPE